MIEMEQTHISTRHSDMPFATAARAEDLLNAARAAARRPISPTAGLPTLEARNRYLWDRYFDAARSFFKDAEDDYTARQVLVEAGHVIGRAPSMETLTKIGSLFRRR